MWFFISAVLSSENLLQVETFKENITSALETLRPTTSWERTAGAAQGLDGVLMGGRGFGLAMESLFNYLGSEYGNTFALGRWQSFEAPVTQYQAWIMFLKTLLWNTWFCLALLILFFLRYDKHIHLHWTWMQPECLPFYLVLLIMELGNWIHEGMVNSMLVKERMQTVLYFLNRHHFIKIWSVGFGFCLLEQWSCGFWTVALTFISQAAVAVQAGVCVDIFAITNEYTDLASLKFLSIESGGSLFLYSSTDDSTLPQDM